MKLNDNSLVSTHNSTAVAFFQKTLANGYVMIKDFEGLLGLIRANKFSYTPIHHKILEILSDGDGITSEKYFIIYPYDKRGNMYNFNGLKAFALDVLSNYDIDKVLIKESDTAPMYVNKRGDVYPINEEPHDDYYLNPAPCSLNESHIRHELGEKFIPYR